MKPARFGTWAADDGLDHTLFQEDVHSLLFTGCGLYPFHDTDGHVLRSHMMPTCVACMAAPPPERTPTP
jgi:hypothetical protein